MGGAPQVQPPKAPDAGQEYGSAIRAYLQNAPQLYATESQYQPMYNQLQQNMQKGNIEQYAQQFANMVPQMQSISDVAQGQASQAAATRQQQFGLSGYQSMIAGNPALQGLQTAADQAAAAQPDQYLTGAREQFGASARGFQDLSAQAGRDIQPINAALAGLYGQVGADTSAADLAGIRNRLSADPRSDIFKATQANVMGNLGQVDPLTGQLKTMASEQLALGSQLSPQEIADAAQQSRAAFSARGMLNSNPSMAGEILNRYNVGQQRLAEREQFGMGVSNLAEAQAQQRTANAMGLTSTDIAATQANLGAAGQMTQAISGINQANVQLGAGLQGQIAGNLAQARQLQGGFQAQAMQANQAGIATQQDILAQQQQAQQMGIGINQYLAGVGQQNLAQILGTPVTGSAYAQQGAASNIYGTGGPSLFQSSGLLSLINQNQMAQMNAQGQAGMVNAQSAGAAQGQMIGAGAAVAGTVLTSAVLL